MAYVKSIGPRSTDRFTDGVFRARSALIAEGRPIETEFIQNSVTPLLTNEILRRCDSQLYALCCTCTFSAYPVKDIAASSILQTQMSRTR